MPKKRLLAIGEAMIEFSGAETPVGVGVSPETRSTPLGTPGRCSTAQAGRSRTSPASA
jgi:hypothetical protein